jgi:hypothetical protein
MDKEYLACLITKIRAGTAAPAEQKLLADHWQQALEVETYPHSLSADQQEALRLRLLGNIQKQIRQAESGSPE